MRHTFIDPDRFVAGTVGEPGERAFFIQATQSNRTVSVALEKAQVQALAARLEIMVSEVKKSDPLVSILKVANDDQPLVSPIDSEFQVGAISLAWDDEVQRICIELFELEDDEEGEADGEVLEVNITLGLAVSFANRSKAVVNAGRLPCPFCAIPIDPRGHLCPRANGYRR
jgi:uncharacterized repeat protein (TIGR03847 family)